MKKSTIFLLPNGLYEEAPNETFLTPNLIEVVASLDGLFAESEKGARRFLKRFGKHLPIQLLNEHSRDLPFLLEPVLQNQHWGVISDTGLPCLADPGAALVQAARKRGVKIEAFSGPSSITLALMLSGFLSQNFAFNGYLPREEPALTMRLKQLEERAIRENAVQIFIETPYRNTKLLETVLQTLGDKTWLCVVWDLTMPTQGLVCEPVSTWKKMTLPSLQDKPAVFLISS